MGQTLLLNASYEPLGVITWYRAIELLLGEKIIVIETYADRDIRSAYRVFKMPAVVVLKKFIFKGPRVKFSRKNLFLRDAFTCQYCGKHHTDLEKGIKGLTFDHVIPRCQGGKTNWTNIVTACNGCNTSKGGRTPAQAGMYLRITPKKPTLQFLFRAPFKNPPEQWLSYLYWDT